MHIATYVYKIHQYTNVCMLPSQVIRIHFSSATGSFFIDPTSLQFGHDQSILIGQNRSVHNKCTIMYQVIDTRHITVFTKMVKSMTLNVTCQVKTLLVHTSDFTKLILHKICHESHTKLKFSTIIQ